MANYTVTSKDWVDLETLMDDDYDSSKDYALYVNRVLFPGLLAVDTGSSKPTDIGKLLPEFATESIGVGAGSTFWLKATNTDVNIYIYEIPAAE